MFKQVIIGLFAITVVALMWTEADAGCTKINGKRVCASWITGSEICKVKTKKLDNADCSLGPCPEVECTVFGTVGPGCDTTLDPTCDIDGILFSDTNPNGTPFNYPDSLSNSAPLFADGDSNDEFRFDETVVVAEATGAPCNQNGKCKTSIEVDGNAADSGVPDFITFTALVFNAQTNVCTFGIDDFGECCSSAGQFFNGSAFECFTPGGPGQTVVERCTVEEPVVAGKQKKYKCGPFPPL